MAPDDVIVDVGGGAGRISLPLAQRCREVIVVDPSAAMGAGFRTSAERAGITNARFIEDDWEHAVSPQGTLALVNHVTYLTREIVPFIKKLEAAGPRRVVITVNSPPPPSIDRALYPLIHEEEEVTVPGQEALANVLWELGILPEVQVLPSPAGAPPPALTRDAAISGAVVRFTSEQWAFWPLSPEIETRLRTTLETNFDTMFRETPQGYVATWRTSGREVLITWRPGIDRVSA